MARTLMRWDQEHESPDLIDRRGEGGGGGGRGVGLLLYLLPWLIRSPLGWLILAGVVVYVVARGFLGGGSPDRQGVAQDQTAAPRPAETPETHFVAFVLDDVQSTWESELAGSRTPYRHAKLVLYTDSTQTGCGFGEAATGPFYCPADERVYIDLGFFHELANRLGAKGQFAQAYVIAHEIGHHVQKILGITAKADSQRGAVGPTGASVRLELQADCFAGIWAHSTAQRHLLEAGDIESAVSAAVAVGDDRLQRQATGVVNPEKWTHGSSAERSAWFKKGYATGDIGACDTFGAKNL